MANVITVSDWLVYKSNQTFSNSHSSEKKDKAMKEYENYNHSVGRKPQTESTSTVKRHGAGIRKPKRTSTFKQFSYESLIAMAIRNSPTRALTLPEIHAFIAENFPYFKAFPYSLKANICRSLLSSGCFVKLEIESEEDVKRYLWTLARKEKAIHKTARIEETPVGITGEKGSTRIDGSSLNEVSQRRTGHERNQRTYSQVSSSNYTAHPQPAYLQAYSQPNTKQAYSTTHDESLERYIHDTPLYPRVPVITPARKSEVDEIGIKIGQVFSLNPQSSSILPTVTPSYLTGTLQRDTQGWRSSQIIPYHPCTLWTPRPTQNQPTAASFVSEDGERYADA